MKVTLPASAGVKLATIIVSSPTNMFNEAGLTVISVGILLTVTATVVEFSVYLLSPPILTVIEAVPSFKAVTRPFSSTLTTLELSGVNVTFKPSGVVVATIVNVSSINKSKVLLLTSTLVSYLMLIVALLMITPSNPV